MLGWSRIGLVRITLPTLARNRATVAVIAVCILMAGLLQFAPPLLMGRFLGTLIAASHGAPAGATIHELTVLFATIAASVAAMLAFQYVANRCGVWLSVLVGTDIRTRLHRAVLDRSFGAVATLDTGTLQARIVGDSAPIEALFSVSLPTMAIQLIFVSGAVALLVTRAPFLAPLVVAPVAILIVAVLIVRRATTRLFAESAALSANVAARISELGSGARAIRLFLREPRQQQRFHEATDGAARVQRLIWAYSGGFQHLLILNVSLCSYLMWYVGGLHATGPARGFAVNDLIALVPIVLLLFQPVYALGAMLDTIPKSLAAADRIAGVLDTPAETAAGLDGVPSGGPLVFDRVRFGYVEGTVVLRNCSFSIAPGEFVALTGASGSGKSTIVNLIARLYEPNSGAVRWGRYAAQDVAPRSWRKAIGVVAQETFVFGESVRENIRCGREWISDEAIEAAARLARADEFVTALPEGYETLLGEGCREHSGGQRQRLGIARALAGDPILLVLDEPSSALDVETETAFLDGLERARRGRTVLLIAHRPSTIERADRELHLADGEVRERPAALRVVG